MLYPDPAGAVDQHAGQAAPRAIRYLTCAMSMARGIALAHHRSADGRAIQQLMAIEAADRRWASSLRNGAGVSQ